MISRAKYDYISGQIWPAGLSLTHVLYMDSQFVIGLLENKRLRYHSFCLDLAWKTCQKMLFNLLFACNLPAALSSFFRRLASKESGYVPTPYIKEIEPKVFKKPITEKVVVKETVKVKRKKLKKVLIERSSKEKLPDKRAKRTSSIIRKKSK